MRSRAVLAGSLCLLIATAAQAAPLDRAREAHPASAPLPHTIVAGPLTLHVTPPEWVSGTRPVVRISATRRATFELPAIFTRTAPSGLRYTSARIHRVTGPAVSFRDLGLPARPYRVKVFVGGRLVAAVPLRVFVPERDSEARPRSSWANVREAAIDTDTTHDSDEESETFVTVSPADPDRIVVGYNDISNINMGPSVSSDGGKTFTQLTQPNSFDVRGKSVPEAGAVSGDPMSAADTLGNVWFGGLSVANGAGAPSRIFVNRIGPNGQFQPLTVGLDTLHTGQQDKPMMTVDNGPDSPTFGRIYIAWDDPGTSGVNEVVVFCDTRVAGIADPARCDDANNWSKPAKVLAAEGSYIYADLAVGPDGTVYYTYWDHSANNAIRGTVCRAEPRTNCGTAGSFGAPRDVAVLQSSPATGAVPFACPTFAAPGGRIGPDPSVDVDRVTNRVYVVWGDLREDSGTTRCEMVGPAGTPPVPTNRTWDVYAASAVGDLPTGGTSATVGTKLTPDTGSVFGVDNDDDFFPWLAIDQTTGRAWADWYTTAGDPTRRTAAFVVAPLSPGAGTKVVGGAPVTVSAARSDYSAGTTGCCVFGNDYGDYTGLDATNGLVVPVWTSRASVTDDGDAHIALLHP